MGHIGSSEIKNLNLEVINKELNTMLFPYVLHIYVFVWSVL